MNSLAVRTLRVPSLVLAAALQVLPITRVALPVTQSTANVLAIIFRWAAGTAAALGSVQAVSGASTVITSPLSTNLVQNQPFQMRLTAAPNQAHFWTASGLPAGLSLAGTNGQVNWAIRGTPTVTGTYNVGLTAKDQQKSGADRTTTATLMINISAGKSPPTISTSPVSLTVTQGQNASFTVTAVGTAPLSYQWRFNGAKLSGQTLSNLALSAVTTANQGNYDVIVTNSGGSVTSSVAALTVIVPVIAPGIAAPPGSLTVTQGQSATFSVAANGSTPLFYQWRFNGAKLNGQNTSNLTINPVTTNNSGSYDVIITNTAGSVTSSVASLTVIVPMTPPGIATPPASLTITQGQSAAFSITANGSAPLFYQWRFKGINLGGQNSSSLAINSATTNNAGNYDVIVTNGAGSVTSSVATLTVIVLGSPLQIIHQPVNQTVTQGQSAAFSVAASGTGALNFQWRFKGTNLNSQINSNLVINPVTMTDAGNYDVIVSNSGGSVTSAVATLTVTAPAIAPLIANQPGSLTVTQGNNAFFLVSASGTAPMSFAWLKNGTAFSDSNHFTGSQSNRLTIAGAMTNDAGNYSVVVSNVAGAVTSQIAVLTVVLPPPVLAPITLQTSGSGTISPLVNGQPLEIGASYTVTATPATGFTFVNWSGGISAATPSLTFVMQSNLVLRANFVSDAVTFVSGTYNGLFYDPAGTTFVNSGPITITTTAKGKYSGSLTLSGVRSAFSGQFGLDGHATNAVARGRLPALALELQLDRSNPNVMTGQVSDGNWTSPLLADRAVFDSKTNVAPQTGKYTLVIPGIENDPMRPAGASFGILTVSANGRVQFRGTLANGAKISQSSALSEAGDWPLYVTLPGLRGSALGWLSIASGASNDISGTVIWLLLQQPSAKFYPIGFSLQSESVGSRYIAPPPGTASLPVTDATLVLSGGNLAQTVAHRFSLLGNNKAAKPAPGGPTLSITTANGLFTGKVTDPTTGKVISFNGAVLQKQNAGYGFFLGTNQSGSVLIAP